jgi:hypothetical protein
MDTIIKKDVNMHLYAILQRYDLIERWWQSPNKAFQNRTPDAVYQTGPKGRVEVYSYVSRCAGGVGS